MSPRFWETQRQYALRKYARHSLSLFLSSFRSARRRRPLALENGQYPCKLNCADVSVKLKRMENRFSRARAPVPFSCLREFHPREDPSLDPIERSGGEERYLGFSFREFARNEGKKRIFVIFLFERKEVLDEIRNFLLFCLIQLRMCNKIFCSNIFKDTLMEKKEFHFSWNENLCDEHFLSLSLDWSTRNRVLFPRSYHLGECRRSLRAETGGTCREYERGRLSSGFSAASRRGPGASSNHANGRSRSHSRKKPFFENFTEKYLPIVAHVVPRYFLNS